MSDLSLNKSVGLLSANSIVELAVNRLALVVLAKVD